MSRDSPTLDEQYGPGAEQADAEAEDDVATELQCQHDDCDREGIAAWNGCVFCDEHVRERLRTTADNKLLARVAKLETALREIGEEISAHGCDGQFEEICIHAERSPEDWCRYCRMGQSITNILPYTGSIPTNAHHRPWRENND